MASDVLRSGIQKQDVSGEIDHRTLSGYFLYDAVLTNLRGKESDIEFSSSRELNEINDIASLSLNLPFGKIRQVRKLYLVANISRMRR